MEKTQIYQEWFKKQTAKIQGQIDDRLGRIVESDHFGTINYLGDDLSEIKFNNGIRIYFAVVSHQNKIIVLLLGGNKNGQEKDIKKAKSVYRSRYEGS